MISVLMVGRNDSHGYNMHKRVAICLNSYASLLDDPNDEILFVDCNTREGLPTLPEAIADTLTEQTRKRLKILRIRPYLYEKYNRGSMLPLSESLSKNVAIRRTNPKNRWILSTTSDNVIVPRYLGTSLTDLLSDLEDGFYELPRFGIPESLWELVKRDDPEGILRDFRRWGEEYSLNNAVLVDRPDIIYDNPGDFQLFPRTQAFAVKGFDERMVRCWHHDSNLARRLFLLNGETRSFLDKALCYHCDHTWEVDHLHSRGLTDADINSVNDFIVNVTDPCWSDEDEWGLPLEPVEEILLDGGRSSVMKILSEAMKGRSHSLRKEFQSPESYNSSLLDDSLKYSPFFLNLILYYSSVHLIYCGTRGKEYRDLFAKFNAEKQNIAIFESRIFPDNNKESDPFYPKHLEDLPGDIPVVETWSSRKLGIQRIYLVDLTNMALNPKINLKCHASPKDDASFERFKDWIRKNLVSCLREEQAGALKDSKSMFIFLGLMNTWGEEFIFPRFHIVHTAYGSHVMFGKARSEGELSGLGKDEDRRLSLLKKAYLKTGIRGAPEGTLLYFMRKTLKKALAIRS